MQYIILDGKKPTHKFKNGEGAKSWNEAKDFDDVAVIVPDGYEVLDFDTEVDASIMLDIVDTLNIQTKVFKTDRGIHCWFKSAEEHPKNFIKNRLAIGIYCDRKAGGRNAYVKIKSNGKLRPILKHCDETQLQTVPKWLTSVSTPTDMFNFKDMSEGSGRNQELFNYIVYLQGKGFKRDEIIQSIEVINQFVLAEPLDDDEIATICRDEAFKSDDVIAEQIALSEKKQGFDHIVIAESIIDKHRLIKYNGVIYEYADGYYQPAEFLRKYVRNEYIGVKNNQVNEVVSYISDMRQIKRDDVKIYPYIINLNNTRYDIQHDIEISFNPDVIEFNRIPVDFKPDAKCPDLDKMLHKVFCNDDELIELFEDMIGYTLIKHAKYQKGFLFVGKGSNGKSTIMNLIKTFYGMSNYSAIPLEKVTDRFSTAELENKYVNIGDDIDNVTIKDTGTLKKLISGDALQVERKGERPYTAELTSTHIYSCNEIPHSFDKSDGFYRRFIMIPFNARFSVEDKDYDPMITEKITTPEALSYLLNIAIKGARRLMKRGKFAEPQSVKNELKKYKEENSNVLSWIHEEGLSEDYFLTTCKPACYSDFTDWCKLSGIRNITGKTTFYKEIINEFDFDIESRQKDKKRYFRIKI